MTALNARATEVIEILDDEGTLSYTQRMRRSFVNLLHKENGELPDDVAQQRLLLQALSDMDRVALTNKRIAADTEIGKSHSETQALVAQALAMSRDPKYLLGHSPAPGVARATPVLGSDVPDPILVEGELSERSISMTLEEFQSQLGSPSADETT